MYTQRRHTEGYQTQTKGDSHIYEVCREIVINFRVLQVEQGSHDGFKRDGECE